MEIVFSSKNILVETFKILLRKFLSIIRIILKPIALIIKNISSLLFDKFDNIYVRCFPKRKRINEFIINKMIIYILIVTVLLVLSYYFKNYIKIPRNHQVILIASIIGIILLYVIARLFLAIYHYVRGKFKLYDSEVEFTTEYIKNKIPRLLKVSGETGAGKDTVSAGISSVMSKYYYQKTIEEIEQIKQICYIFDFHKLDEDLSISYRRFLTFSKKKIEKAFIGDSDSPGMAIFRNLYLNEKYHIKAEELLQDYYNFIKNPVFYETEYASGVRVMRKHFLELIMFDYIEDYIRINVEENFLMSNQPMIEDLDKQLMAKQFNFNFLKSKIIKKKVLDRKNNKKIEVQENILFPWKNRIIVNETECDTWWNNRNPNVNKSIKEGGIRDTKAYNRHMVKDLMWIQIGQNAERTDLLLRELEHGYLHVYSRTEVENNIPFLLQFRLKYACKKIAKIEKKYNRNISNMDLQKIEDCRSLYEASSNDIFLKKIEMIQKKYRPKEYKDKYYILKNKISKITSEINNIKKEGYIKLVVCLSKQPEHPAQYDVKSMREIMRDITKVPTTFVAELTFNTSDCERYDTRYLLTLAEERSSNTKIEYAECRRWSKNMKMNKEDVLWLGYGSANEMFGITEEEEDDILYGDGYKKYKDDI